MTFDDDKKVEPNRRPGLKIKNDNSMFANQPKKPTKQEFDMVVKKAQSLDQEFKERAADLAINFRKILEDKTLIENKNLMSIDLEREIIGNLAQLAVDMNNNENEEKDGMGGVGLSSLLFRCMLIQRDKINSLDYSINQLNKSFKELQLLVDEIKKS